ncbi:hypothetical protein, partial [Thiohalocapsa marina]|uniref:hypothetical protein n=1 Tax=Thiohalocapsa marina TaxID=424902 RepID=UPI0036D816EB
IRARGAVRDLIKMPDIWPQLLLLLFNSDFALASRGGPYMDKRSAVHQTPRWWTALRLSTLHALLREVAATMI